MSARKTFGIALALLWAVATAVYAWTPVPVKEDPLVRMPGSQPDGSVTLESPNRCLNCHGDYFQQGEPGFNWQGSMMAHAARDFLFWPAVTVALQDSIWATGRPNAGDICLRCHLPKGWLEGRSDPVNASAMTGADFDGVQCDLCHRMYDPQFEAVHRGLYDNADWQGYWDESNLSATPSNAAAEQTYLQDRTEALSIFLFNGNPFFGRSTAEPGLDPQNLPASPDYTEAGGGQMFVARDAAKRSSFADAEARHQMFYSRFNKSRYFCAACHDVSNPVLANLAHIETVPGDSVTVLPTEEKAAHAYLHVERTFSEFMLSAYGRGDGAEGIGPFAPTVFHTSRPGNRIATCQDCHMRDVVGAGANKQGTPIRPGDSTEHPKSGLPLHDLTGGNAFVPWVLASSVAGSSNYDELNANLINQGAAILTLDPAAGQGLNPDALLAGAQRALQQLSLAASIDGLEYDPGTGALSFRIQNRTGHKLISGYPEGRRMFVNIRAYDSGGEVVHEINPYDADAATLKGLQGYTYADPYGGELPSPDPLAAHEVHVDELVYEAQMQSSLLSPEGQPPVKTFHFALADDRYKDNRIPPKGFLIDDAATRMVRPVVHGTKTPELYSTAEYDGGYDQVDMTIVQSAVRVEVKLYYQSTSREYMEFLRDEIDGRAATLSGEGAYRIQSDDFFSGLKAWGETVWVLWRHNRNVPGAAPILMAQASIGAAPPDCTPPIPTLQTAAPGNAQVTLSWSDEHSVDPDVSGYAVYHDQAGKAQPVAETGNTTQFTDTGLSNGNQYCYKVTSRYPSCESGYSNILCAVPNNQGQAVITAETLESGYWQTSGKGSKQTTVWVSSTDFSAGDRISLRVRVVDASTGLGIENAAVEISITGAENMLLNAISDAQGIAAADWQTTRPNRKGGGGTTPGSYGATVTSLSADGYTWDGPGTGTTFTIQ